jgi:hexosaminidase
VDYIANHLDVKYDVISNLVNDWLNFTAKITMKNTGGRDLMSGNWELYFFSIRLIQPDDFPYADGFLLKDCNMKVHHVGGSLFKLTPERQFSLKSLDNAVCTIVAKYWQSARTDCMPNWYVAAAGMEAKNIVSTQNKGLTFVGPFTKREQYIRYPEDEWRPYTPEARYDINKVMTVSRSPAKRIIPTPVEMNLQTSTVTVDSTWKVVNSTEYFKEIQQIAGELADIFGYDFTYESVQSMCVFLTLLSGPILGFFFNFIDIIFSKLSHFIYTFVELFDVGIQNSKPSSKFIEITTVDNINILDNDVTHDEAYWIDITGSSINISVKTMTGVYHAYQSLWSLGNGGNTLPIGLIKDQPRFQYRGMHVDVGRNFHSKEEILKILDAMSMYKLNKFYFHLTEDEGWRLEIPGLPELTGVNYLISFSSATQYRYTCC